MSEWVRKPHCDADQKCTWFPGTTEPNPHMRSEYKPKPKIMDTILDNIGNTPLVRINKVSKQNGLKCELLAKCDFYNAGGSVKDRIGKKMVADAETSGRLKKGDILIEPTSGNTGIGLALSAAVKGYKCIITMPEKMSNEKVDVLKALGAQIIRTPNEAAFDSPDSHIGVASRLQKELPNAHILDQYANPSNPMAHYDTTAEELWDQCDGKIDMIVMSVGTGGTIAGNARRLKELNPNIIVVGVDPLGSILAQPESLNVSAPVNLVEGIGYDFIPRVLDRTVVDYWVKSNDRDSLLMSRRLIRDEGLLCGGSSGAVMSCAVEVAKTLKEGQRCVVLLADSVRNYMTKFLADSYMHEHGFVDGDVIKTPVRSEWWAVLPVSRLPHAMPVCVSPSTSVKDAIALMNARHFDMIPVQADDGSVAGVVTEGNLTAKLTSGKINADDTVAKAMYKQFRTVSLTTPIGELASIFDKDYYALITTEQEKFTNGVISKLTVVSGVVTRIDLLNFMSTEESK